MSDKLLNQKEMEEKNSAKKDYFETGWSNIPNLDDLAQDATIARDHHSYKSQQISTWLDNLHVRGSAKFKPAKNKSGIQPKLIRKQAEWRYPNLSEPFLSSDRVFKVEPVTGEDRTAARNNEIMLMYQFNNKIDSVGFIDNLVRAAVEEGTAIVKVGWHLETKKEKVAKPVYEYVEDDSEEFLITIQSALETKEVNPSSYLVDVPEDIKASIEMTNMLGSEIPLRAIVTGTELVEEEKILQNHPTVEVCDYRDIMFDPSCKGVINDARFAIHRFRTTLSELKKAGIYKNLDNIYEVTDDNPSSDTSKISDDTFITQSSIETRDVHDNARKKLEVNEYWGYWDINGDGIAVPIVVSWVGKTIIRMSENPYPDGKIPFIVTQYLPVRNEIYGEPDGALLEDNQKIIGAVSRGIIDIVASTAAGQKAYRKNSLSPSEKLKMERGENFEVNEAHDIRNAVHTQVFPDVPASAKFMIDWQNTDAESMTGVTTYNQGINSASLGNVASLGKGALDAASRRELSILRRISKGVIEVGKRIIAMNAEFLEDTEIIRITNEDFIEIQRDSLYGEFDLKLSISTFDEDAVKAQELAFVMQTMGNTLPYEITQIVMSEMMMLRKLPDVAQQIRQYVPEPDPMEQQRQEMELMLLQAKINSEEARAAYWMAQSYNSETGGAANIAKANALQAQADKTNLDFVEQETGTKQARDMQLRGEQAKSQGQLKILDHSLKMQEKEADDLNAWRERNLKTE